MEWLDHKVAFIFPYLSVTGCQHELGHGSSAEPVLKRMTAESCPCVILPVGRDLGITALTPHAAPAFCGRCCHARPFLHRPPMWAVLTDRIEITFFAEPLKQDQSEVPGGERSPPSKPLTAFNRWLVGVNKHPSWRGSDVCVYTAPSASMWD